MLKPDKFPSIGHTQKQSQLPRSFWQETKDHTYHAGGEYVGKLFVYHSGDNHVASNEIDTEGRN